MSSRAATGRQTLGSGRQQRSVARTAKPSVSTGGTIVDKRSSSGAQLSIEACNAPPLCRSCGDHRLLEGTSSKRGANPALAWPLPLTLTGWKSGAGDPSAPIPFSVRGGASEPAHARIRRIEPAAASPCLRRPRGRPASTLALPWWREDLHRTARRARGSVVDVARVERLQGVATDGSIELE
jgi:hypothetical protein